MICGSKNQSPSLGSWSVYSLVEDCSMNYMSLGQFDYKTPLLKKLLRIVELVSNTYFVSKYLINLYSCCLMSCIESTMNGTRIKNGREIVKLSFGEKSRPWEIHWTSDFRHVGLVRHVGTLFGDSSAPELNSELLEYYKRNLFRRLHVSMG